MRSRWRWRLSAAMSCWTATVGVSHARPCSRHGVQQLACWTGTCKNSKVQGRGCSRASRWACLRRRTNAVLPSSRGRLLPGRSLAACAYLRADRQNKLSFRDHIAELLVSSTVELPRQANERPTVYTGDWRALSGVLLQGATGLLYSSYGHASRADPAAKEDQSLLDNTEYMHRACVRRCRTS